MPDPAKNRILYRFGPFELNPAEGKLSRNGTAVKLQDLPYRLLLLLVERAGELVTREEVRQRLWPENTFVEFDNSLGVAIRKVRDSLGDDAETPRYVETVPRKGYRFFAPVTVDGATALSVPAGPGVGNAPTVPGLDSQPQLRPPVSRYWVIAILVLLLVGAAVYELRSVPGRASSNPVGGNSAQHVRMRRSVAVMGFRNLPGRPEDNWLSAAFSEMLNTELAAGGDLRLVSGEDVARAKRELPLNDEDSLAKATLERLRKDPGADVVVVGSYTALPGSGTNRIRLDIRAQDTAAGETIAEDSITGNESDLFDMAHRAGVRLRLSLGVASISPESTALVRASLPSSEKAVQLYTEGRSKLWAFDFLSARDLLIKAVAADPNYPLSHSALSEAWWHMGYGTKAKAEAQKALDLSAQLPQEERLLVEGQYRRAIGDWPKTVEAYQSLLNLFPDSLDYGLLLASAQAHVNATDSLQTLEGLRRLPSPAGEDARIDMEEASAWIGHDMAKAQEAAKRAIAKGRTQGSHAVVARTYGILCQQGPSIGLSTAQAIADCEDARQSSLAAGDRNGEATMLTDLAVLHYQQGDLAQAEMMWTKAIKEFREVGDAQGLAATLNNLGAEFFLRGRLEEAKKFLKDSIPSYQEIGDKDGVALALNNLGDIARQTGDLEVAATTYQQARATAQEIDDKDALGYVLVGQGDILLAKGDLPAARKMYQDSLAVRNQAGEKLTGAESEVSLAQLSIEEGHATDAEVAARKARDQFHQEQQADDELAAATVLVGALLAQGKQAEASKEVESAVQLAAKSQNTMVRLQFDLVSAGVALASNKPESARTPIRQTLAEARKHGYVGIEFDASLALAKLELKSGQVAAARTQLSALEKSARSKGFGLIAGKAAAARTEKAGSAQASL
jgi:DNA-binding winged helix-turn-helix (wHTH) protein/tetratricopeptide (TPR) repeat protein